MYFVISPLLNIENTTDVNSINNYLVGATTKESFVIFGTTIYNWLVEKLTCSKDYCMMKMH